jgi:hypothetical protein
MEGGVEPEPKRQCVEEDDLESLIEEDQEMINDEHKRTQQIGVVPAQSPPFSVPGQPPQQSTLVHPPPQNQPAARATAAAPAQPHSG